MKRFLIYVKVPRDTITEIQEERLGKVSDGKYAFHTYEVDAHTAEESNTLLMEDSSYIADTFNISETIDITKEHIEANPEWEDSFK